MQRKTLFTLTMFWSAMLLFMVQPLFARMALPLLGGAPSVWNVALVFFQVMLLFGYLYAHGLQKFRPRTQILVHVALLLLAAVTLPLDIPAWYTAPSSSAPTLWLLGLLTVAVGLPFFALAAQAPLMQSWFSLSDDKDAQDPYFLYAASNIGSMLGLLAYPLAMEPMFGVATQNIIWAGGFACLILIVAIAAKSTWAAPIRPLSISSLSAPIDVKRQLHWILLAAIPSGLLVAVTNILTTDLGSLPMLWVLPLMLYLLSFVIAFSRGDRLPIYKMHTLLALTIIFAGSFAYSSFANEFLLVMAAVLFPFFLIATACHGKLVSLRPSTGHMTRFYVLMSFGGAIGGIFSSLLAPVAFNWIYEYPILIILSAAVLAAPKKTGVIGGRWKQILTAQSDDLLGHLLVAAIMSALVYLGLQASNDPDIGRIIGNAQKNLPYVMVFILAAIAFDWRRSPLRFAFTVALSGLVLGGMPQIFGSSLRVFQDRSFFGVSVVSLRPENKVIMLQHGTTVHGAQSQLQSRRYQPQTYYSSDSGIGQVMQQLNFKTVGLVGLGTGALSCYHQPNQSFTYFEIDPMMVSIAKDRRYFSYVSECTPNASIILGDARLNLQRLPTALKFDLLAIDAFSSDSIPMHLMTAEALKINLDRLADNGLLMIHISNRFFDLEPVVERLTQNAGLYSSLFRTSVEKNVPIGVLPTPSIWVAVSRDPGLIQKIRSFDPGWRALVRKPDQTLWTDDFSTPLEALKVLNK
jgi:hypothetical protein